MSHSSPISNVLECSTTLVDKAHGEICSEKLFFSIPHRLQKSILHRNVILRRHVGTPGEGYLEPSRISTMEVFFDNSYQLKGVNYFPKRAASKIFDWALNTPLIW